MKKTNKANETQGTTLTEILRLVITVPPATKKHSSRIVDHGKRCPVCKRGAFSKPLPSWKFAAYQEAIGYFLGKARGLDITSPVNVKAHYYIDADRKSDLCNYHAALHDALVFYGVIRDDNRLIIVSTDGSRVCVDRENPRTEVFISPADLEGEVLK